MCSSTQSATPTRKSLNRCAARPDRPFRTHILADLEFPAHTTRTGETPTATKEHKPKRTHILAYNPHAALLYHERLEGRSIKIHCEDDLTLAIVWDSGNFAHLCGLDYYLDDSKRCRLPPRKLYEDLLRGRRISPKRVSPHGDVQWLKKKADVLTDAMDMSKVTHVVVPGNSRIVLYAGNEVWCIGLGRMRDGRYYPQPLVKKSFDEVRKTGTVTHIVAAVETMGL